MRSSNAAVGVEAVGTGMETRGVADDGAPPRPAGGGASDDGGGLQAAEYLDEKIGREGRPHVDRLG